MEVTWKSGFKLLIKNQRHADPAKHWPRTLADQFTLVATIDRLIANRKTEETRAVFQAATRPLRNWFSTNSDLSEAKSDAHSALLREMADLRYVASLRASVNRNGNWDNSNY